jgi:hypothetical protein
MWRKNMKKNKILAFVIVLCMLFSLAVVPTFAAIVDSGTCGDNLTWTLDDGGKLTISGTGAMADYLGPSYVPWDNLRASIKSVMIENGVTCIKDCSFYNCVNLISATISNSVTRIERSAFDNCSNLTNITIPNSVTSIGNSAFDNCRSLTSVTIPSSVTSIGNWAFAGCSGLTSITIPNSVTSIGESVFYGCSSLTSATIPNSMTSTGERVFYGCSSLTSVTIPDSVTSIEGGAFFGCSSLESVAIPNSVTSIGTGAFGFCSGLTNITIPDSVTSIGDGAFANCSNLTSLTIPDSVTSIGDRAFSNCNSLTSINVFENNQNYSSPYGILFNKDKTVLICYPNGRKGSYTIPNSVTSIGYWAFQGCSSLTSVTIPDSVTSIGDGAFQGCSSLTSVAISDSVASIGGGVFADCSSLTYVKIPDGVTSIEGSAFYDCSNLTSITIPDSVISVGEEAFRGCNSLTDVYYSGDENSWNNISINSYKNGSLTNATRHYNHIQSKVLTNILDYSGKTMTLLENGVLDIGGGLYFRNGYVNASNGYIKAGDKKITGENIYFTNEGKIRLGAGYTAKVELDNGDGTTDQGFLAGMENPRDIVTMTLEVSGTANDVDYTGRTIAKDFDFTNYEVLGLVNFGFSVNNIPKPLSLSIQSIE